MTWQVKLNEKVRKTITKIDAKNRIQIERFIDEELPNLDNPRSKGKPLHGGLSGSWRYRVGDYRVLAQIIDEEIIIRLVKVAHRKEVYK